MILVLGLPPLAGKFAMECWILFTVSTFTVQKRHMAFVHVATQFNIMQPASGGFWRISFNSASNASRKFDSGTYLLVPPTRGYHHPLISNLPSCRPGLSFHPRLYVARHRSFRRCNHPLRSPIPADIQALCMQSVFSY